VSSPGTCRSYCEVRPAAEGVGSTLSRNAEFIGSFFENDARRCVTRRPEPYGVRALGGTRNMTVVREGVLARRLSRSWDKTAVRHAAGRPQKTAGYFMTFELVASSIDRLQGTSTYKYLYLYVLVIRAEAVEGRRGRGRSAASYYLYKRCRI
jgi:hypothetical protein